MRTELNRNNASFFIPTTGAMALFLQSNAVLTKCGHVVCQHCIKTFVDKDKSCVKCSAAVGHNDIIELVTEGMCGHGCLVIMTSLGIHNKVDFRWMIFDVVASSKVRNFVGETVLFLYFNLTDDKEISI